MSAFQIFTQPSQQALDTAANVLSGATLTFSLTGTSTATNAYADKELATPLANPLSANSAGVFVPIFLDPTIVYRVILKSAAGVTLQTWDPANEDVLAAIDSEYIATTLDSLKRTAAEVSAGVTPVNYAYPPGPEIDPRRYDASTEKTTAENKTAIQTAISVAGATTGGAVVVVPPNINYGYDTFDTSTQLVLSGHANPVTVIDYSQGNSYAGPPAQYDGAQVRYFFYTPTTTNTHDGNGIRIRSNWAPYLYIITDYELPTPRTADDNFRATVYFGRTDLSGWGVGQGTIASATASADEMMNFYVASYGGPLGDFTPLIISFATGNVLWNTDSNAESAAYHFKARSTGYLNAIFEALTTTCELTLRNSNGSGDDVSIKNVSGQLRLNIPAVGDALSIDKTSRAIRTFRANVLNRALVTYSSNMTIDVSGGNFFTIAVSNNSAFLINTPSNASDGQRITIKVANTSGGALGTATWDAVFKMASWTQPANGFSRSIDFWYDGANWIEVSRTPADIPN